MKDWHFWKGSELLNFKNVTWLHKMKALSGGPIVGGIWFWCVMAGATCILHGNQIELHQFSQNGSYFKKLVHDIKYRSY